MGWRRFLRRGKWDRERSEEIESYLRIETEENFARGMALEEALSAAAENSETALSFDRKSTA